MPTQVLKVLKRSYIGFHKFKALKGLKFWHFWKRGLEKVLNSIKAEIEQLKKCEI